MQDDRFIIFKKLYYFRQVANCQSLRKAATELGITQPALSRHLQELENELGVSLILRRPSGNKLTEAGEILAAKADELIAVMTSAKSDIDKIRTVPSGVVTLGLSIGMATTFLTAFLQNFRKQFPQIHLRIIEGSTRHVEEWLEAGQAQIGIICLPCGSTGLIQESLIEEELFLFSSTRPITFEPVQFSSLEHMELVLPCQKYGTRRVLDRMATEAKIVLRPVMEADNPSTIKDLVTTAGFSAIQSEFLFDKEIPAGRIFARRIVPTPVRSIVLATSKGEALSWASRSVAREIAKAFKRQRSVEYPLQLVAR